MGMVWIWGDVAMSPHHEELRVGRRSWEVITRGVRGLQ